MQSMVENAADREGSIGVNLCPSRIDPVVQKRTYNKGYSVISRQGHAWLIVCAGGVGLVWD